MDIYNYKPYFFIEIPQDWNNAKINMFILGLKDLAHISIRDQLLKHELTYEKPLTHFTGLDTFKFLKLIFGCITAFKKYDYLLRKPITIFGLCGGKPYIYSRYESNISPMLRFTHESDLNSIGWIHIKKYTILTDDEINTEIYARCNSNEIIASEKMNVPAVKYLSFDIESDSSHSDFPIATKDYTKLSREMLIEYCRLKIDKKSSATEKELKQIIQSYIQLAFNSNYANNGVSYCGLTQSLFNMNKDQYPVIYECFTRYEESGEEHLVIPTINGPVVFSKTVNKVIQNSFVNRV